MQIVINETQRAKIAIVKFSKKAILEADASQIEFEKEVDGVCILFPTCRKLLGTRVMTRKITLKIMNTLSKRIKKTLHQVDYTLNIKGKDHDVYFMLPSKTIGEQADVDRDILHDLSDPIQSIVA